MRVAVKIPKSYQVGGQEVKVCKVDRCDGNCLGTCHISAGEIEIADTINKDDSQSEGSKQNTFYHELVRSILHTMGEQELNDNEKFVCCFAGFLTEAMKNAYFHEEEE